MIGLTFRDLTFPGDIPDTEDEAGLLYLATTTWMAEPYNRVLEYETWEEDETWEVKGTDQYALIHAWSPRGTHLAAMMNGGEFLAIWDTNTKQRLPQFSSSAGEYTLAFSSDGKYLCYGTMDSDNNYRVYDFDTEQGVSDSWDTVLQPQQCAWSPDGSKIAFSTSNTGTGSSYLYVIDTATGDLETGWPTIDKRTFPIVWSPDGTRLVVATNDLFDSDNYYVVIDVASKTIETGWPVFPNLFRIFSLSFSPDGEYLTVGGSVSSSNDRSFNVIDTATKTVDTSWPDFFPSLSTHPSIYRTSWSSDGKYVAFRVDNPGSLRVVSTETKEIEYSLMSNLQGESLAFHLDPGNSTTG